MIEANPNKSRSDAICKCDFAGCRFSETVKCRYENGVPAVAQVQKKLISLGWTVAKKATLCPNHKPREKTKVTTTKDTKAEPVRKPSREQKREIMDLLRDTYDTKNGRYMGEETDHSVASLLEVMEGWVAELREEFFGPAGSNEDITAFKIEIQEFIKEGERIASRIAEDTERLNAHLSKAVGINSRIAKIEKAVGPVAMRRV